MSEHSAGPWSVSTRNSWRIVDPHDNTIASTGTDSAISHDAHKANARLIAAAPDLFDACASVWADLADTDDARLRKLAQECRAALGKVMGG